MTVVERNNVRISGNGPKTMLFAHGFGCDQNMWRYMTPAFEESYRVVLFDHVGAGNSDIASYNREKYGTLDGFAVDVLEICDELRLKEFPPIHQRRYRRASWCISTPVETIAAMKEFLARRL